MDGLTTNQILALLASFLTLVPSSVLIYYYIKTRILDFLLFALFIISGFLSLIADPLADITNHLFFYQLHFSSVDIALLILFFHGAMFRWNEPPKVLVAFVLAWFFLLTGLTLLWEVMLQPEVAKVLFWELPRGYSDYFPRGAGITLSDGTMIYSTAFHFIADFYRFFVLGFLIFVYTTTRVAHPTKNIILARRLWIAIWIMLFINTLSYLPWFLEFEVTNIFNIIGGLMASYITIFIPEGLLLSQSQILRVNGLYAIFQDQETKTPLNQLGVGALVNYIKSIVESDDFREGFK